MISLLVIDGFLGKSTGNMDRNENIFHQKMLDG
jgi:hypothetical protein